MCCGTPLFASDTKFDAGCGWPSYFKALDPANVREERDTSHGMTRTEIICNVCDAHLGHVFPGRAATDRVALLHQFCVTEVRAAEDREDVKLLFDLFPVAAFFIAYRIGKSFPEESAAFVAAAFGPVAASATFPDLVAVIVATTIAIVATLLQVGWLLARRQPVKPMLWLSAILIVAFGGMTIWLQNELFIKWKPSLLYWSFAAILVGGRVLFRRNLLSALLGSELATAGRGLGSDAVAMGRVFHDARRCESLSSRITLRPSSGSTSRRLA